jgi:serine phosphatase RsbU (regulator of sigma subunit)
MQSTQSRELNLYREKCQSLEQMLTMNTSYMQDIEKDLSDKKAVLQAANSRITESMNFSKIMLDLIYPEESQLKTIFADAFSLNMPKETIGGDGMWVREHNGLIYLACLDCTGHGIPGALLSMAAFFSLNATFESANFDDPAQLINSFSDNLTNQLTGRENKFEHATHGLDMGMCIIDKGQRCLKYAGTHQSLVRVGQDESKIYKGGRGYVGDKNLNITSSSAIKIAEEDRFYLFTDGFPDQFGGNRNKKMKAGRLLNMLKCPEQMEMKERKAHLKKGFNAWKGDAEQTDDALIIGFKL